MLKKNLIANTLNQILGVGFPVLIQSYIIRVFELEDIAYWNIILSTKAIVILYVSFFNIYLIKKIAENKSFKKIQFIITNSIAAICISTIIPFTIYYIYLIANYPKLTEWIIVSSLPLITFPFSIEYLYQGKLRNDFIFYRRIIIKLLFVIILFTTVKDQEHFIKFVYITSLLISIEHIINLYYGRMYVKIRYVNFNYIRSIFKGSLPYLPFLVTFNILPHLSIVMSYYSYSPDETGIYSILFRLINLATTFVSSAAIVLLPMKLKNLSENKGFSDIKFLLGTIIVAFCISLGLIISKELIFFLFLDEYLIQSININYYILTMYIPIHSIYNYLIFNKYFANDRILVSTTFNLIIIGCFMLLFILARFSIVELLFATNAIISAAMGLISLIIYHNFTQMNIKDVWNSRFL